MKNTFYTNDLIYYDTGYYQNGRGIHQYCKIIDIIQNEQSIPNIKLITGHGDKNTKATFVLKIIGEEIGNFWHDMNSTIKTPENYTYNKEDVKINNTTIKTTRTHNIHKINIDESQKIADNIITKTQNKLLFLKQHQNRNDKIDTILS